MVDQDNKDAYNIILSIFLGVFIINILNNIFDCPRVITKIKT